MVPTRYVAMLRFFTFFILFPSCNLLSSFVIIITIRQIIYFISKISKNDNFLKILNVSNNFSGTTMTQELVWLIENDLNFEAAKTYMSLRYIYLE